MNKTPYKLISRDTAASLYVSGKPVYFKDHDGEIKQVINNSLIYDMKELYLMKNTQQNQTPTNMKIAEARRAGIKVRVCHFRNVFNKKTPTRFPITMPQWAIQKSKDYHILNRGGHTLIQITKDGVDSEALSVCSPEDNFSRAVGVNRCLVKLGL